MKFVRWVAVSQTESSRRPSISGGLFVRPMTAVGRPRGVGANPPPPPPVPRRRGPASGGGAGPPAGAVPKASAPLTGCSGRAPGAAGGIAEPTGGAGVGLVAGAEPAGTNLPGAGRAGAEPAGGASVGLVAGAEPAGTNLPGAGRAGADPAGTNLPGAGLPNADPAGTNLPGAGLPDADTGADGPPPPVESRVASTAATSSWMSKMSAIPPSIPGAELDRAGRDVHDAGGDAQGVSLPLQGAVDHPGDPLAAVGVEGGGRVRRALRGAAVADALRLGAVSDDGQPRGPADRRRSSPRGPRRSSRRPAAGSRS